ncbi:hypothetical protein [Desulfovibrio sp. TomC]|uniref:hypothetical protein n=1 Tax=Desulfovibrio sp. TomC TaxID=1562888 RepID=UPI000574F5DE|nr:hypothetical protein [Desulfovibrio sp. TomC]KHK03818.1 putative cell-wall-anchored protein SasA (LPXTG motif) [Desulfovibrio sp. TomC]
MATSVNTSDVVNWAYQYSLASAKLSTAQSAASSSATRRSDIATAQADFNATMKSLVPAAAQSSVQFQYFDAYTNYNTALAGASSEKERQAAMNGLLTELSGITLPTPTSSTLDALVTDTLSAQKTNLSNAAAGVKAMAASAAKMASNASAAWNAAIASSASALNSQATSMTDSLKNLFASMGLDASTITTPTASVSPTSAFAAGSATAATSGTPGTILNAALIGFLTASEAANSS